MKFILIFVSTFCFTFGSACDPTETTASGTHAPLSFCSGDLIFEDNFDNLDVSVWKHENTMWGGGNGEFQWYTPDRTNLYTSEGNLHFMPTLTAEIFGEEFLTKGRVEIPSDRCTQPSGNGCDRQGSPDNIINPIRSSRITSWESFRFKYGILEARAKIPAGDWIWPAIWFYPKNDSIYGGWPVAGEIDLMESRGNREMFQEGVNTGVQQVGSTLHFGPNWEHNAWYTSSESLNRNPGFDQDYHLYKLHWSPDGFKFFNDDELVLEVPVGEGFWARGGFESSGLENPWTKGTLMAPFDEEFFIVMNLAVGGTNGYFSDSVTNPDPKPWANDSPRAAADFWSARDKWEATWNRLGDDSHMKIDYVRVWAL